MFSGQLIERLVAQLSRRRRFSFRRTMWNRCGLYHLHKPIQNLQYVETPCLQLKIRLPATIHTVESDVNSTFRASMISLKIIGTWTLSSYKVGQSCTYLIVSGQFHRRRPSRDAHLSTSEQSQSQDYSTLRTPRLGTPSLWPKIATQVSNYPPICLSLFCIRFMNRLAT